jgi:hypothetical protein
MRTSPLRWVLDGPSRIERMARNDPSSIIRSSRADRSSPGRSGRFSGRSKLTPTQAPLRTSRADMERSCLDAARAPRANRRDLEPDCTPAVGRPGGVLRRPRLWSLRILRLGLVRANPIKHKAPVLDRRFMFSIAQTLDCAIFHAPSVRAFVQYQRGRVTRATRRQTDRLADSHLCGVHKMPRPCGGWSRPRRARAPERLAQSPPKHRPTILRRC